MDRPRSTITLVLFLGALVWSCSDGAPVDDVGDLAFPLVEPGSDEELGMIAFVNAKETTAALLDDDVALDRRAAANIIARRDGPDGIFGTSDDEPFTSVSDLDTVAWVGPTALERILAFARDNGWIGQGAVSREAAILALVNAPETTVAVLDDEVPLDKRAASNIIQHRDGPDGAYGTADDQPFKTLAELDAIPYVGKSALDKLASYALANGYGQSREVPDAGCAIISEVVEGSGNYNKAVEITNCGDAPLALDSVGLCLVRNDDTSCTVTAGVGQGSLAPGATWVVCRSRRTAPSDPFPGLVAACDHEIGTVASFNGDDRLVLFSDRDQDGALGDEPLHDVFGDIATRPSTTIWSDAAFRRCDLTPHTSGPFDVETFIRTELGQASLYDHLGVAPTQSCGEVPPASAGDDCLDHEACEEGLRCYGRPSDGSTPFGKCVDPTPVPGQGAHCDRYTQCSEGLICAGWTLWGEGTCVPSWMAARFEAAGPHAIADPPSGGIASSVVVYGLASVPVDLEVVVNIDHPRPTDLRVTLIDPNGAQAVLWDRSAELETWSRSFVTSGGISRDDQVNGRWQLRFEDLVAGQTGSLVRWKLFVVSRFD